MATSGYTDVKVTNYDTLRFSWEIESQDFNKNTSEITWRLQLISGAYGAISSTAGKTGSVTINGVSYPLNNLNVGIGNNTTRLLISSATLGHNPVITHNANGLKTFNYSFSVNFNITFNGASVGTVSGSGTGELEPLKKYAIITSAPDFNDEANPVLQFNSSTVAGATKVEACITSSDFVVTVPYRQITIAYKTDDKYTFPLTDTERDALRALVTKGNTASVYFMIRTTFTNGSKTDMRTKTPNTLTIINGTPTLNPSIVDQNVVKTYELTGNSITLIRYYSRVLCSTGAAARKGAAITSQSILNSNYRVSRPTGTFNVSDREFVFTATDSRGQTVTESITKPMVDYIKPTIKVEITKPTNTEFTALTGSIYGDWFNSSFGVVANTYKIEYRYKENGGEYSSWSEVESTPADNTYTAPFTISNVDYRNAYTVQARITDKLFTITSSEVDMLVKPIFDWGRDDFNFNVPISIEGQPLADYVIETGSEQMGSNGTWYWRKWKSGKAEAWGCRNFGRMAITTAWGGLYRSGVQEQLLPGVFLYTPDVVDITLRDSDFGGWVCKHESIAPTSQNVSFMVVRPASATTTYTNISFNIIGRWK